MSMSHVAVYKMHSRVRPHCCLRGVCRVREVCRVRDDYTSCVRRECVMSDVLDLTHVLDMTHLSLIHARDMSHSQIRRALFMCGAWRFHGCDMTHWYMRHDWLIRLIHLWAVTHSSVTCHSFILICDMWLIHTRTDSSHHLRHLHE